MWGNFLREEDQFREKGKLGCTDCVHCVRLLFSNISGKFKIQGTVVSVLKAILNPVVFVF